MLFLILLTFISCFSAQASYVEEKWEIISSPNKEYDCYRYIYHDSSTERSGISVECFKKELTNSK